jgi:AAA15 family ATPase/GTPase
MKKETAKYKEEMKKPAKVLRENSLDYSSSTANTKVEFPYASLEIKNFRCLKELHMGDLGQVNLIAGMNNVGKTALLEAIFLHIGSANPELALRVDRWRGLGILSEVSETPWRNLFWQFQDKDPIKLVSKNQKRQQRSLTITVSPSPSTVLEEMKAKEGSELLGSLGQDLIFSYTDEQKKTQKVTASPLFSKKGEIIRFQLHIKPSLKSPPFTGIFLNSWRQGISDEEVQRFTDLRIKNQDHLFLEALKYIEPRLERLEILSPKGVSMIYGYLSGYDEPVPFPLLGDGARRMASLVLSIGAARDGVVLVDEIENGIHHSVMKSLWEVIAEAAALFNTQVFATTHSQECVYAAHEAFKSREEYNFRLHRLNREDGKVKAITYDQESLEGAFSIPLEVRG